MGNCFSPLRVGVFYDGNFLLHASNYYNYIHEQKSRLSISGLHSFIRSRVAQEEDYFVKKCHIVEAHYFRGRINAVEAAQRGNQLYNDRVFEDIMMAEGVHTHYLPLRNYLGKREESGIDVWLSLEVFQLAMAGSIDVAVLIVSDTNYVPLIRKLTSLGIRVMLLSWEFDYTNDDGVKVVTKTSYELLQLADYPVAMHREIEKGLANGSAIISQIFVDGETNNKAESIDADYDNYNSNSVIDEERVERSEILSIKTGFGFVRFPNNNLFFHSQDVIEGDFSDLAAGDAVEFTIGKNQMNQDVAKNVRKITD